MLLSKPLAPAGSVSIKGKVTDQSGIAISGVTITCKQCSPQVVVKSASDGSFVINVSHTPVNLSFSHKGYATVSITAESATFLNVILTADSQVLYEMAVPPAEKRKDLAMKAASSPAGSYAAYNGSAGNSRAEYDESYATISENGMKNVSTDPLSTFSIDVDNASYSNVRRYINMGQLPPSDAVRIEEMINYFRYDYPEPDGKHPFSLYTELGTCPWNSKHLLFMAGLKGKSIDKSELAPSNLVFLIDVSGSMDDPMKLPLLKSAFSMLVNELRPADRVAIVVYAGAAGMVLESTPGNKKETILAAIDNLEAGGSTAGGAGIKLAYAEATKNFIKGGNNRIILATDGDFNVGESGNGSMERLVEEKRKSGIFMTVLGFGMGNIKDDKMEIIADKGNGNYAYIDNLQEARRVLVREFGGTLFTIAKDVKFQVEFNPARVSSYRLIGYENRMLNNEDFNDDSKDAGEMGSGHTVTALYEIVPADNDERPSVDPLKYSQVKETKTVEKQFGDEYLTVKLRYKLPDESASKVFDKAVTGMASRNTGSSANFRFAAAVAEFGMILRNSDYKGSSSVESILKLAQGSRGEDNDGYRAEFMRLVSATGDLKMLSQK